jgi:hypothetical protein
MFTIELHPAIEFLILFLGGILTIASIFSLIVIFRAGRLVGENWNHLPITDAVDIALKILKYNKLLNKDKFVKIAQKLFPTENWIIFQNGTILVSDSKQKKVFRLMIY